MRTIILLLMFFAAVLNNGNSQSIFGIDVSHYQGTIDWDAVASDGIVFAWVKSTEGKTYDDPNFQQNMTNGINAGVVMGAYHFARPDNNSASDEANHFLAVAGDYIGDGFLPPVLDLEDPANVDLQDYYTSSELTAWVQEWMDIVENATGVRPVLYTMGKYTNYLQSSLNVYPLWIADPDDDPSSPPDASKLGVWNDWAVKQYTWTATVSGISTNEVDKNVFNGTNEDFMAFINDSVIVPENDECANAILLQSSTDCNPVSGTVDNANPDDGFAPGSCDDYSSPLGAGVFYKFVATNIEHTITVDPLGDLDAVVVLYHGTDCGNLVEIQCEDTPGGGGVTTIMNVQGLNVGDTYYIRVYDYGSVNASNGDFNICVTNPEPNEDSTDIYLSSLMLSTVSSVQGDTLNTDVYVEYMGYSNSPITVHLNYYISQDAYFDANDVLLANNTATVDVSNSTVDVSTPIYIPLSIPEGSYFLIVVADPDNEIPEIDENNNTIFQQVTIQQTLADQKELSNLKVYPNPAFTVLNVESDEVIKELTLIGLDGKVLRQVKKLDSKTYVLNIETIPSGVNYLIIETQNNDKVIEKIIKN